MQKSVQVDSTSGKERLQKSTSDAAWGFEKAALPGHNETADVIDNTPDCEVMQIDTTTTVKTGAGKCIGFIIHSGTNVTITAYDNTSASGDTVHLQAATSPGGTSVQIPLAFPRKVDLGLHVVIGGTSPIVDVLYQ